MYFGIQLFPDMSFWNRSHFFLVLINLNFTTKQMYSKHTHTHGYRDTLPFPLSFSTVLLCLWKRAVFVMGKTLLGNDTCQCFGMGPLLQPGIPSVSYTLCKCQGDVFRWCAEHCCKGSVIILPLSLSQITSIMSFILWKPYTRCQKTDHLINCISEHEQNSFPGHIITTSQSIHLFNYNRTCFI